MKIAKYLNVQSDGMSTAAYLLLSLVFLLGACKEPLPDVQRQDSPDYQAITPINSDGTIHVVVEIPAGTTAKYEMNKRTHTIQIDSIDGQPRYINYLGYPGNYGMIPNTILPKSKGGDGDPLDVLLLGESLQRGSVHRARAIGVMKLLDNGEQDDKILAVPTTDKWSGVHDLASLDQLFPGARDIVSIFFVNYKTRGEMVFDRWESDTIAMQIIHQAAHH